MAIDPSIALGVQPFKAPDQMNMLAQVMGVQQAQNQNALAQYSLGKAQRQDTQMNSLMSEIKGGLDLSSPQGQSRAISIAPEYAPTLIEHQLKLGEIRGKMQEQAAKRYNQFRQTVGAHLSDPDPSFEKVAGSVQGLVDAGVMDTPHAQSLVAALPRDPQELRGAIQRLVKSQMEPKDVLTVFAPKPEKIDNGQQISFVDQNPNSPTFGKPIMGAPVQKVADPNATLSADTSTANNKRTVAASYANANATHEIARATRDAAQITGNQNTEMKLGDDYRAQSKNFKETADAYKQISAVLDKATTSPAATLAGATKFMKMIDPGSVVRESELGMALAATGVFDRASNYFNTLQSGKVLTASQVADFKAITKQINDAAAQQQKLIDNHYSTVAKQYGLRPEMVVQDFGQNGPAPAGAGAVPADIAAILAKHGGGRKGQ